MIEGASCGDCKFWKHSEDEYGKCHRYPPVVDHTIRMLAAIDDAQACNAGAAMMIAGGYARLNVHPENLDGMDSWSILPATVADHWCGEFQPQEKPEVSQT